MTENQYVDSVGNEIPKPAKDVFDIIESGYRNGETQVRILDRIRQRKGKGIRDDYLRQALRYLRGDANINPPPQYKYIELGKSPNPERLRKATGITTRQFSYTVAIVQVDCETREPIRDEDGELIYDDDGNSPPRRGHLGLSSSRRLTRQVILDEAMKMVDAGIENYATDIPECWELIVVDAMVSEDWLISGSNNFIE